MKRLILATLLFSGTAVAAPPKPADAKAVEAERLFEEGKRLIAEKRTADACHAFEESQKLDPAVGTQFNIADCYERQGRLATAYKQFIDLRDVLVRVGDQRASQADARVHTLEPRLPHLLIHIPWEKQVTGLVVKRNEQTVASTDFESPLAADPGTERVVVQATNKKSFTTTVELTEGHTTTVDVPLLAEDREVIVKSSGFSQRSLGLVVGGVGIAAIGTSVLLAFIAKGNYDNAVEGCNQVGNRFECPPGDKSANAAAAQSLGTVATIVGGIGGAALIAGVVLFLTAPKARGPEKAARLLLDGRF